MLNNRVTINESMNQYFSENQVLVFYGSIADFYDVDWLPVLSEKEIARAEQYLVPSDKRRYVISRAILKRLLSRFLQIPDKEIELNCGKNGKPFLSENTALQFNSSHSGEAFVIGFARNKEIGIDVENLNRSLNISALQTYLFSAAELECFHNIPHSCRQETFINCWTTKEAILKATGDGLTLAMNTLDLDVSLMKKGHFPSEIGIGFLGNNTDWFLESYTLMDNYRGTVAVKGHITGVQYIPIGASGLLFN